MWYEIKKSFSLFLNDVKLTQKCKSVGKLAHADTAGVQTLKARVALFWNGKKRTRCQSGSCDVMLTVDSILYGNG